jgi:hypothetical protein
MTMTRPEFTPHLSADEFLRWYWLKEELAAFCRLLKISTAGSKPEMTLRIAACLAGNPITVKPRPVRSGAMPKQFAMTTTIGAGWRCSPGLGAFFKSQCGNGFRFNVAMRDFIHTQAGRTLEEAVACYRQSVAPGAPKTTIPPQLEYNRHTREFYEKYPGATRQQVLDAWWAKRSRRAG